MSPLVRYQQLDLFTSCAMTEYLLQRWTRWLALAAALGASSGCRIADEFEQLNYQMTGVSRKLDQLAETNRRLEQIQQRAEAMDNRLRTLENAAKRLEGILPSSAVRPAATRPWQVWHAAPRRQLSSRSDEPQ